MTQVDQVTSGLLTDLAIGGKAMPAAAGAAEEAAASRAAAAPRARAEILTESLYLALGW